MNKFLMIGFGLAALSGSASAEDYLPKLKQINIEMCIRGGVDEKANRVDPKFVDKFCTCITNTYWDSVPKSAQNELFTTGESKDIDANLEKRWNAAGMSCKKKIGM